MQRIGYYLHSSRIVFRAMCVILAFVAGTVYSAPAQNGAAQAPSVQRQDSRPNIILLLFDDVGYSDMSALGGEIHTPTIAQVAREGTIVDRFYTTPWCSPTRAGILTGRYPHDVDMADLGNPGIQTDLPGYRGRLPLNIPLVSELLQEAGYVTYLQGKWHLGDLPQGSPGPETVSAPNGRGFDHFFGFLPGEVAPYPGASLPSPYLHNERSLDMEEGWYSIDGLNRLMLDQLRIQLESGDENPFFIYFPTQAVHLPLQAPGDLVDKYREVYRKPLDQLWRDRVQGLQNKGLFPEDAPTLAPDFSSEMVEHIAQEAATRAAMLEAADAELGKLLRLLKTHGELDNTFILIASDNGAHPSEARLTGAPLQGSKGGLYEGGIRSPLLVKWPAGGVGADRVVHAMTTYLDVMPTLLQVAGVSYPTRWRDNPSLPPLEGRSLLPLLRGESLAPPEYFFWDIRGNFAVMYQGRWKLFTDRPYDAEQARRGVALPEVLVDVISDPTETKDLYREEAAMVKGMHDSYQAWIARHGVIPYYQVLDARKGKREKRESRQK